MEITVERVTPTTARHWLDGKRANRRVTEGKVESYAADMKEGRWRQNGVPIVFNEDGALMDGQHRLLAVIEYGKPIELVVARGVADEAMVTFDVGIARRLKDFLQLRGEQYAEVLAAMVNTLARYEEYGTFQRINLSQRSLTIQQALEYFDENAERLRYAAMVGESVKRHTPMSGAMAGTLYVLFAALDEADADDFMDKLASGARLEATDPVYLLRRRLIDNRGNRDKLGQHVIAALAIKAWNAYRAGRPMSTLSWRPGGKTPEAFPVPE